MRFLAVVSMTLMPHSALAQTLHDALASQLIESGGQPCALLLSGDSADVLGVGGLNETCTRPPVIPPIDTDPGPSSGGVGVAATPPSAPIAIVTELKEDEEDTERAQRGFFFTIGYDSVDRDVSPFEDGYASDLVRLSGGFDWAVGDSWILGIAADGSEQDGDFLGFGNFSIRSLGLAGFGAYLIGDNGSVDFYSRYSSQSHDRLRRTTFKEIQGPTSPFEVAGTPTADFDADQVGAGLHFSYDWTWDNITLGPQLAYDWYRTDYDTYNEVDDSGLALTFHDDEETSSQFSAGLAGSAAISTNFGAVLIGGSIFYRYEDDQVQRDVQVSFVEDTRSRRFTYQTEIPDREFIDYFAAVAFVLPRGLQIFLVYRGNSSHDYLNVRAGTIGFRKEF